MICCGKRRSRRVDEDVIDTPAESGPPPVDGVTAAAILFLLIGEDAAARLIGKLEPAEVRALATAVYAVDSAGAETIDAALRAFATRAGADSGFGGRAHARLEAVLDQTLGTSVTQGVLAPLAPPTTQPRFDRLHFLTADVIGQLLEDEHPQLCALVCAHLDPSVASAVIGDLPEDEQEDVLFRLATLEPVTPDRLAEAEALLMAKPTRGTGRVSRRGGATDVAAILNGMGKADSRRALKALTKRDKDLGRRVEEEMLTFADLARLDDRGLGTLLRAVDNALLVPALKGAEPGMRGRCLGCMSSRAAQSIEDELAERGPMPLAEVEAAQRAIVAVARRLADEGVLMLGQGSADYV
jgi:flagellar motor switch protein FliG